jgi:hypothetical protein
MAALGLPEHLEVMQKIGGGRASSVHLCRHRTSGASFGQSTLACAITASVSSPLTAAVPSSARHASATALKSIPRASIVSPGQVSRIYGERNALLSLGSAPFVVRLHGTFKVTPPRCLPPLLTTVPPARPAGVHPSNLSVSLREQHNDPFRN